MLVRPWDAPAIAGESFPTPVPSLRRRPGPRRLGPRNGVRFRRAKSGRPGLGGPRPAKGFEADSLDMSFSGRLMRGGMRLLMARLGPPPGPAIGLGEWNGAGEAGFGRTFTKEVAAAAAVFGLERRRCCCALLMLLAATVRVEGLPIEVPVRSEDADEALE